MRPEQDSDYQWPAITAATLLADLRATREADQAKRLAEALRRHP